MSASSPTKSMTIGESGLSLIFAVTAVLCVFAAAKALDTAFAFHASLAAAASAASVFFILNRYFERGDLPPQEINGRPNDRKERSRLSAGKASSSAIHSPTVNPAMPQNTDATVANFTGPML